jgi:hypothetical protein
MWQNATEDAGETQAPQDRRRIVLKFDSKACETGLRKVVSFVDSQKHYGTLICPPVKEVLLDWKGLGAMSTFSTNSLTTQVTNSRQLVTLKKFLVGNPEPFKRAYC